MQRIVWLAVGLAALSGCSGWEYHKPGVTAAQIADDSTVCRRATTEFSVIAIPTVSGTDAVTVPSEQVDRAAFNRCMAGLGYTVRGR